LVVVLVVLVVGGIAAFVFYRRRRSQYMGDQVVMGQVAMGTVTGTVVSGAYDPAPVQQAIIINTSDSDTAPMVVKGELVP